MKKLVKLIKPFVLPLLLAEIGNRVRASPLKTKLRLTDEQVEELIEWLEKQLSDVFNKL